MEHAYGQLNVNGKEGEQFALDIELKPRGDSNPRQDRQVNILVKSSSSEDTLLHCKAPQSATFKALQEALTPLAANLGCKGTPAWKALDETNGDFFWVHKTCHHCRIDEFDSVLTPTVLVLVLNTPSIAAGTSGQNGPFVSSLESAPLTSPAASST